MLVLPEKLFRALRKDSFAVARPLAHVGGGRQREGPADLFTDSFPPVFLHCREATQKDATNLRGRGGRDEGRGVGIRIRLRGVRTGRGYRSRP